MAYKSTIQESTGCSSNLIMFGLGIMSLVDLMLGKSPSSPTPTWHVEYVELLRIVLADSYNFVSEHLWQEASKQKKY